MFIDLSVEISEKTPVYLGDPLTKIVQEGMLDRDGYQDHYICLGTHVGTHIDAPSHMLGGGENINQIPLERFCGRGVCIEIGKTFDISKIKKAPIREGDIVLFRTGMSDLYREAEYYDNYPAVPEEAAEYLIGKKIKIVGVDMCSPDHPPYPIHKILLRENILIIENLTNLASLRGKEFKIYAFPVKLELDGSPVRVVAEVSGNGF